MVHNFLRGVATNIEPAAQEFNYHSGSNCDPCANAFYNFLNFNFFNFLNFILFYFFIFYFFH